MSQRRRYQINYVRLSICALVTILILVGLIAGISAIVRGASNRSKVEPIASLTPNSTPAPVVNTPTVAPQQSVEETPAPTETPAEVDITIKAIGDIAVQSAVLDGCYDSTANTYNFSGLFAEISSYLQSDLTIASLETVCVDSSVAPYSGAKSYNTPSSFLSALSQAGVDAVTLANSHILDQGMTGIEQTISALEEVGINHFGAYSSAEQASSDQAMLMDVKGVKVAVLSYTDEVRGNTSALSGEQLSYAVNMIDEATIIDQILRVQDKGADVVLVCLHWGDLYTREPNSAMRTMAEHLLLAGADVIIGTHPQQAQRITNKDVAAGDSAKRGVVAYSLGNFLSEDRQQYNDSGYILNLKVHKDMATGQVTVGQPGFTPIWIDQYEGQTGKTFRVLPMNDYQVQKGSLSEESWTRLKAAYQEITGLVGDKADLQ